MEQHQACVHPVLLLASLLLPFSATFDPHALSQRILFLSDVAVVGLAAISQQLQKLIVVCLTDVHHCSWRCASPTLASGHGDGGVGGWEGRSAREVGGRVSRFEAH